MKMSKGKEDTHISTLQNIEDNFMLSINELQASLRKKTAT